MVGDVEDPATRALLAPAWARWRPFQVMAVASDAGEGGDASAVPLLADRVAIDGHPTAYVCRGFVCDLPVTTPAALEARLGR